MADTLLSIVKRALYENIVLAADESFACREYKRSTFQTPWHFHREYELTLILRGCGMRYAGDSIERFADGDLVLLGTKLPHYWWNDREDMRGAHSIVVQFDPNWSILHLAESLELRRLLIAAQRGLSFSGARAREVADKISEMASLPRWQRLLLLLDILGALAGASKARPLSSASYAPVLDERDGKRLQSVCKYVNDSYGEGIAHGHAARLAGFSSAAFSRFFHKRMGKTFESYVAEVRVGHACRLLMERDRTISETAFEVGFNNLSNFNRHFRRLKGMSPNDYRSRSQE